MSEIAERVVAKAKSQLYVREKTNQNDGPEVEVYLSSVSLKKGYSWCMAFVFWLYKIASEDLGVKNPVPKTAGVLDCLRKAANQPNSSLVKVPEPGDQFIMDFGSGKGHTGIIVAVLSKTQVKTIEGNTSADPKNKDQDREGGGVYERTRNIKDFVAIIRYTA